MRRSVQDAITVIRVDDERRIERLSSHVGIDICGFGNPGDSAVVGTLKKEITIFPRKLVVDAVTVRAAVFGKTYIAADSLGPNGIPGVDAQPIVLASRHDLIDVGGVKSHPLKLYGVQVRVQVAP